MLNNGLYYRYDSEWKVFGDLAISNCTSVSLSNNLALKRPAYQSSVKEGKPEVANDGVNNLELGAGAFTSTNTLSNQWWRVDLGALSLLEELVVFTPNNPGMVCLC